MMNKYLILIWANIFLILNTFAGTDLCLKKHPLARKGECLESTPCQDQHELNSSEKCLRTYRCVSKSKINSDQVILGIATDKSSSISKVVAYNKKTKDLEKVNSDVLSTINKLYSSADSSKIKVSNNVSYDVEKGCDWTFRINHKFTTELNIVLSEENNLINLKISKPSKDESKLFRLAHPKCYPVDLPDKKCKFSELMYVTDLDNDGNKEFWYNYTEGYRDWYLGQEFSKKENTWREIFFN